MLSTINAAETQFRHESEARMREHALLVSIRERRAARDGHMRRSVAPTPSTAHAPVPRPAPAARQAWARPIGIKNCETAVCAA